MKLFHVIATGAIALTILSGCTRKSADDTEIANFVIDETIKTASRSYVATGTDLGDTIYASVSASLTWPEKLGDASLSVLQDSIKAALFGKYGAIKGIDKAIKAYVADVSAIGDSTFRPVDSIPPTEAGEMAWYLQAVGKITDLNEQYVTYQASISSYAGGAHPMTAIYSFSYDLDKAMVLTAENIFVKGSEGALLKIVRESLARQYSTTVDKLDEAGFWPENLNYLGDVYLSDGMVMFHYGPYAIAPYSMGDIDIAVWNEEITDYLAPSVIELLQR